MTLIETLNGIHLVGDATGLTFFPEPEFDDVDPDWARLEVAQFIDDEFSGLPRDDKFVEATRNLCIYGASLFAAIDSHGADASECDT
jgi:hypothetical protein